MSPTRDAKRKRGRIRNGSTSTSRTQTTDKSAASPSSREEVPVWLARSPVYKRLPMAVLARLDEAILVRPANHATLEEIAGRFRLVERYKISLTMLRTYARKLEDFVRPAMTSHVIAGLLGCLPEDYRQRLATGSQVLLLSRVVQALTAKGDTALSVAELAKLASVLSSLAGRSTTPGTQRERMRSKGGIGSAVEKGMGDTTRPTTPTKLAEVVRAVYGIAWPPVAKASDKPIDKPSEKIADIPV